MNSSIIFNAHRIISLDEAKKVISSLNLEILEFAYIDDFGDLHEDISLAAIDYKTSFKCKYGSAIWMLSRI